MYNEIQFNEGVYNGGAPITESSSSDVFQFNGYGLQNLNIIVSDSDHSTSPKRSVDTGELPRRHGVVIYDAQYREKIVTLEGHIKANSSSELEDLIKEIKKELSEIDGNLDITIGGETQRYIATLINSDDLFSERKGYHITFCPFKATFLCSEPYGHDVDYTIYALSGQTSTSVSQTMTNDGSADADPVFIITIVNMSGFSSLTVSNNTTIQSLTISEPITAGDIITIDAENQIVTLNSVEIDFDGSIPYIEPGDSQIVIEVDSTSHSYDVTYKHKNAYL